jgi:hypothetical protein
MIRRASTGGMRRARKGEVSITAQGTRIRATLGALVAVGGVAIVWLS